VSDSGPGALRSWLALLRGNLVPLRGQQADHYRAAAKHLFGLDIELSSFHVDRMGFSPELAQHHGNDYLGFGRANRFAIIVSPRQREARLLRPTFSFDPRLLAEAHTANERLVARLAPREALFGELEDDVDFLREPSDLLLVGRATLSLASFNGSLADIDRLTQLSDDLGEADNLLRDDYVNEMLALLERLGEAYVPGLRTAPVCVSAESFACELFGGAYVLRSADASGRRTLLIHGEGGTVTNSGNLTLVSKDSPSLPDVLHERGYVSYLAEAEVLQRRLRQLEDDLLVSQDVPLIPLDPVLRKKELVAREGALPSWYWELRELLKQSAVGNADPEEATESLSSEAKLRVASPCRQGAAVGHLLAELDPSDYARLFRYNAPKLLREFATYPQPKQELLVAQVTLDWGGLTTRSG